MAPEVYYDPKPYDAKSDMWALGCVLYELLMRKLPFEAATTFHVAQAVGERKHAPVDAKYSPELRLLVDDLLQKDPSKRPSAAEVMSRSVLSHRLPILCTYWLNSLYPGFPKEAFQQGLGVLPSNVAKKNKVNSFLELLSPKIMKNGVEVSTSYVGSPVQFDQYEYSHLQVNGNGLCKRPFHGGGEGECEGDNDNDADSKLIDGLLLGESEKEGDDEDWFASDLDNTPEFDDENSPDLNKAVRITRGGSFAPVPNISIGIDSKMAGKGRVSRDKDRVVEASERERVVAGSKREVTKVKAAVPSSKVNAVAPRPVSNNGSKGVSRVGGDKRKDRVPNYLKSNQEIVKSNLEYQKMIKSAKPKINSNSGLFHNSNSLLSSEEESTGVAVDNGGILTLEREKTFNIHQPPVSSQGSANGSRSNAPKPPKHPIVGSISVLTRRSSLSSVNSSSVASPTASEGAYSVDSVCSSESFRQQIKRDKLLAKKRGKEGSSTPFEVLPPRIFQDTGSKSGSPYSSLAGSGNLVVDDVIVNIVDVGGDEEGQGQGQEERVRDNMHVHMKILEERVLAVGGGRD
jgi:serine/threonine protein kinase